MNAAINTTVELEGRFKLVAVRSDGTERLVADWFKNLITDAGLDMLATNARANGCYQYCQIGTGNNAPAASDTALQSRLTGVAASNFGQYTQDATGVVTTSPRYAYDSIMYEFATGTAAGNISEIGIAPGTSGTVFSRALVLDAGGNPTTVTVLSDEILRVYYELRWYIPETDTTGTVTLEGIDYAWTQRAAGANSVTSNLGWPGNRAYEPAGWLAREPWYAYVGGDLGPITAGEPSGSRTTGYTPTCTIADPYVAGNFWVEYWAEFSTAQLNADITSLKFQVTQFGTHQMKFVPPIPKTNTKKLRLKIRTSWARRTI